MRPHNAASDNNSFHSPLSCLEVGPTRCGHLYRARFFARLRVFVETAAVYGSWRRGSGRICFRARGLYANETLVMGSRELFRVGGSLIWPASRSAGIRRWIFVMRKLPNFYAMFLLRRDRAGLREIVIAKPRSRRVVGVGRMLVFRRKCGVTFS